MGGFTRTEITDIRTEFQLAVEGLEEKFGISMTMGNISYDKETPTFTSKINCKKTSFAKVEKESNFKRHCLSFGLTESDYKRDVIVNGKKFQLTDIKPRNRTYPFIVSSETEENGFKLNKEQLDEAFLKAETLVKG